ncbi:hypothetical protein LTR36_001166 [Oleoguttula mirabilis]|uniref:Uncharacterized protein n=1 Tax=Oleoguttula mirabilis TaxID=1507867 RepID=A0AAV9J3E8_9PEZI|nr:hypothetical protein LTR36_001166 [Oleoguttula mirabilis]
MVISEAQMDEYEQQYRKETMDTDLTFTRAYRQSSAPATDSDEIDGKETALPLGHLFVAVSEARDIDDHLFVAVSEARDIDDDNLIFRFKNGNVIISLAPFGTDDLLLPSQLLVERSAWFKAALRDEWWKYKLLSLNEEGVEIIGSVVQLDLVYESDGGSTLKGRSRLTSELDRLKSDNSTLLEIVRSKRALHDDYQLDSDVRDTWGWNHGYPDETADPFRRTVIEAHKIGFALMLDLPFQLSQLPKRFADWPHSRNETLVVLKVLEFADTYSTFDRMAEGITKLILGPELGKSTICLYPGTYLRVACVLHSREIFDIALPYAALRNGVEQLEDMGRNVGLEMAVLQAALHLERSADNAISEMLCLDVQLHFGPAANAHKAMAIWSHWLMQQMLSSGMDKWLIVGKVLEVEFDVKAMAANHVATTTAVISSPVDCEDLEPALAALVTTMKQIASRVEDAKMLPGCESWSYSPYLYPWEYNDSVQVEPPTTLTLMSDQQTHPQRRIRTETP